MTDSSPKQIPPYGIRIPLDLKARIQSAAEENSRSLHAEIIHTLLQAYPRPKKSSKAEFLAILDGRINNLIDKLLEDPSDANVQRVLETVRLIRDAVSDDFDGTLDEYRELREKLEEN